MALFDIKTSVHPGYKPIEEPTAYYEAYMPEGHKTRKGPKPAQEPRSWQIMPANA